MASKPKRAAPEDEATTSSSKKRSAAAGNERLSKIIGNVHPLLIPLVLDTLFLYMTALDEVKRNRLVCNIWLKASEPQWTMLTKTLTLFRAEVLPQGGEISSDEVVKTLQQLREMCEGTSSALQKVVPYRKFKFQNWTFDSDLLHILNTINEPITTTDRWFWNRIGLSLIKSLTLENCDFPVLFLPFKECILRALPNLESLNVINCTTTMEILKSAVLECISIRQRVPMDFNYTHQNLKNVHLHVNKQNYQDLQPVCLIPFFRLVPSLERFRIGDDDPVAFLGVLLRHMMYAERADGYTLLPRLREMHLLDFSSRTYNRNGVVNAYNRGGPDIRLNNLEEFHYDIGYGSEAIMEIIFIALTMPVLSKLHLYRAPLSQPLANFVEGRRADTVTELHLWGNVSSSLEFLNAFPNLRVLKWVTSCYEEKFHGYRVTSVLEESEQLKTYPLLLKDVVGQSGEVSTMEHLTTFELDCGPIYTTSWYRLGLWMPNLKSLKGIVSRAEHLGIIREQWKQLDTLELAHGSKLLGGKLLKELAKFEGNLKTFEWKGCACTRKLFGKRVFSGLQETEKKLGSQLPAKCTFPWNANLEGDEANVCKHAVLEETLMSKAVSATEWYI